MKVIDCARGQQPAGLSDRLGSFRLTRGVPDDIAAQDYVISVLQKGLDNRFVLLRNVTLDEHLETIPLILIGPPGLTVIHPSTLRGLFRAKGDEWDQMDERRESYRPANPNLIVQTQQFAQAVKAWIQSQPTRQTPPIDSAIIFTDQGIHIEMARPSVRIVMIDGIERFVSGLLQGMPELSKEEIQSLSASLSRFDEQAASQTSQPEQDVFSLREDLSSRPSTPSITDRLPRGEKAVSTLNKIPLTNRQWLVLGCLGAINIAILIALVLYILFTYNA